MGGMTYDKYSVAVEDTDKAEQDLIRTHQEFADAMRMQDLIQKDLINNSHELDRETGNLNETKKESIELTEEELEAEKKLARDRATAGIDALQKLNDAYQNLRDMEQDRLDLVDKEAKALTKLNKANANLEKANEKVNKAKEEFEKVSGLGAKITNEEALAIARQKAEIEKLEQAENQSEIQKLQLAVAREKLIELEEKSVAISREEEQALRNIEQAEADVVTQTERLQEAQQDYQKAQEELAKATADSTENILEQAIAKQQLDEALQDLKSAEKFKDGISEIVRLIGGDLDEMSNKFQAIFNLSGRALRNQGISTDLPTTTATPTRFGTLGEISSDFVANQSLATGGKVGTGAGNTVITVNTGALLGTDETVQLAVAEALKQAQRKGIEVAL